MTVAVRRCRSSRSRYLYHDRGSVAGFVRNGNEASVFGVGVGIGSTAVAYGSLWSRNVNPTAISTGEGLPNVDDIRQHLAATTSSFQGILSDTLVSQQVWVGVHYALSESLSAGVKSRWVHSAVFESDEAVVWDPLRSHVPNLRRDGSEPVSGQLLTDARTLWGVGLSLTYHFYNGTLVHHHPLRRGTLDRSDQCSHGTGLPASFVFFRVPTRWRMPPRRAVPGPNADG